MVSAFNYMLDRSVGLPSRGYRDNLYSRQCTELMQHPPSTSNYIFRQGMHVWTMSLDPLEQRFLLVGTSRSQLLVFDLLTLDEADGVSGFPLYNAATPLDPLYAVQAKSGTTESVQFGISMVDWYPVDGGLCISSSLDHHIKVWDTETFTCVTSLNVRSKVYGAKFSPVSTTHTLIAAATSKGEVRLVDLESSATAHSLLGHQAEVWTLEWSPASEFVLATGSRDGDVRLWDIRRSGATACLLCLNSEGKAAAPRRSNLDTNVERETLPSINATARKRTRGSGAMEAEARARQRARTRVATHPERLHASMQHTKRSDPHNAASASFATAHEGGVASVAYTPDGRYLLSLGMDGNLRLWHATSGDHQFMHYEGMHRARPRAAKSVQMAVVQEARAWDSTVVFVSNGSDGALASYRVFGECGAPLGAATAHYQQVTACLYRKSTRELFSAGEDGLVMRWKPQPVELDPNVSNDMDERNLASPSHEVEATSGNVEEEDAWSEDEEAGLTGHTFIPPILRDEV